MTIEIIDDSLECTKPEKRTPTNALIFLITSYINKHSSYDKDDKRYLNPSIQEAIIALKRCARNGDLKSDKDLAVAIKPIAEKINTKDYEAIDQSFKDDLKKDYCRCRKK